MAAGARFYGPYVACGEEVGTGAAIRIPIDFKPIAVKVYNRTRNSQAVWNAAMPEDSMQLTLDSGAGTTDISFVTSNAISSGSNGLTIGSNASINTASDVIYWEAYRSFR